MVLPVVANHEHWYAKLLDQVYFPHPLLSTEEGLVAVGGQLDIDHLLLAYNFGLFPWYNEGEPILWWSPDPRCVLYPQEVKIQKSMRSIFHRAVFQIQFDLRFTEVMTQCKIVARKDQNGTWINDEMIKAYSELFDKGIAHSVEILKEGQLVGGLYGLSLGRVFFGESMFSLVSNASKTALIALCLILQQEKNWLIDCQQVTPHLLSLGATVIPRKSFFAKLKMNALHSNSQLDLRKYNQDFYQIWHHKSPNSDS